MKRVRQQPDREDRILCEIVVDAHNETERAMGWYYYLQDAMQMSSKARCKSARSISPLRVGDEVQVVGLAAEDDCMTEVFVFVKQARARFAVPLAQLECHSRSEETCQAVADWHYWVERGYEY